MTKNKTLVLGASENPARFSNMAIKSLRSKGYSVLAIGRRKGKVGETEIHDSPVPDPNIDTVTVYLNPDNQKPYYQYILSLKPRRIIFNPGAENPDWKGLSQSTDIQLVEACTLVMLQTGQY